LAKKYLVLLATDVNIKKIPVVLGPVLNRIGMFYQPITHEDLLARKIDDVKSAIKWQLKKVTCLNVVVGNEAMNDNELRQNIFMSLIFLASLLKKEWLNLKAVNIKKTMGGPVKLV